MYTILYLLAATLSAIAIPTIPVELEDYTNIFSAEDASKLPPIKVGDYTIDITDNLPYGPLYNLSAKELTIL